MSETQIEQQNKVHVKKNWFLRFKSSLTTSWGVLLNSVVEWPIKRPIKVIVLFLILIYMLITALNMWLINTFLSFNVLAATVDFFFNRLSAVKNIFSNNGRFDWYALSALIAGLTYLTNSAFNRKKFRADLISKSRIEWLQIVRNTMAEYLTKARMYLFIYQEYFLEERDEDDEVSLIRLNKYGEDLDLLKNKLHLYISDNNGNQKLNTKINRVTSYLNDLPKPDRSSSESDRVTKTTLVDDAIVDLLAYSREYIKNEWERAKRGK